eukprot:TRINITY_DN13072_c0_g1_i1.p1 TRINITY_DN13072_c0_g1~~TRINITY_DN13072_c0_g1_i1.p1  ORF type:complete len:253 (+),score=47.72 TRINITY_DN13072_c0_g1_i1:49-807(+)
MSQKEKHEETRLRMLCLHGFLQNASQFRGRLGAIRRLLKHDVEFDFVDAPFCISSQTEAPEEDLSGEAESSTPQSKKYGWYTKVERDSILYYDGWKESLLGLISKLLDAKRDGKPYDGVLAFSQGALMATLLAAFQDSRLIHRHFPDLIAKDEEPYKLRCLIVCSGAMPFDHEIPTLLKDAYPIKCPSLHVYGKSDQMVLPERSITLSQLFHEPNLQAHDGGHFIPTSPETRIVYKQFIHACKSSQDESKGD